MKREQGSFKTHGDLWAYRKEDGVTYVFADDGSVIVAAREPLTVEGMKVVVEAYLRGFDLGEVYGKAHKAAELRRALGAAREDDGT